MLKKIAYTILILFALSLFGFAVKHVHSGGQKLGVLTKPLKVFTSWFELLKPVSEEVQIHSKTFQKTPNNFEAINQLTEDVVVLYSYSQSDYRRAISIKNLRDDSTLYTWKINKTFKKNDRLFNPVLAEDKNVIFHVDGIEKYLVRIDSTGQILYESDTSFIPHHSVSELVDNCVWTPGKSVDAKKEIVLGQQYVLPNGKKIPFKDNALLKWDVTSGQLVYQKSFVAFLIKNGYRHLLKKAQFIDGPFHSNDVEPVVKTTRYYDEGDVFISIRNMSLIVQFRPSNDSVIRLIEGPFSYQHDVDITSDSTITFFNNNTLNEDAAPYKKMTLAEEVESLNVLSSEILEYNFASQTFRSLFQDVMQKNKIFTHYEGLHHWLPDGSLLIEEQEKGVLWIINARGVVYKNVLTSQLEGYHHMLNWTRVVSDNQLNEFLP